MGTDLLELIQGDDAFADIRDAAQADLGAALETARKENTEAVAAYPAELDAQEAYSRACMDADPVLVHGSRIVRAVFGSSSPEYRQFISRGKAEEEEAIDEESALGE